jgi:hypothetical protein
MVTDYADRTMATPEFMVKTTGAGAEVVECSLTAKHANGQKLAI